MMQNVLILGGTGRIGRLVAADLLKYTPAQVTIAGRSLDRGAQVADSLRAALGQSVQFQAVDLADRRGLKAAIAAADLVIHCAGPFCYREPSVLHFCIEHGAHYIDISDHPAFTQKALAYHQQAQAAGITAVLNTGVFPGISNSMVRRDVEQLDPDGAEDIHLSYVVAGSGGAGLTVMKTTFLGLQRPFEAWIDGQWQRIQPYSDREVLEFPEYGRVGVYWFNMPEALTLPESFRVKSVMTKFGTVPQFYNHLTWSVAHQWPKAILRNPLVIEGLSRVSYLMTQVTDRWSQTGVAIRSQVTGTRQGQPAQVLSTLFYPDTATLAGIGAGTVAELILSGSLHRPGVWPVEQALSTDLFEQAMATREIQIPQQISSIARLQPTPV